MPRLLPRLYKHLDPDADIAAVVVVRPSADEVAVHDAGFVYESPAADLQIEPAFGDGRHPPAPDAVGVSWYLHTVTNTRDWFVPVEEMPGNAD